YVMPLHLIYTLSLHDALPIYKYSALICGPGDVVIGIISIDSDLSVYQCRFDATVLVIALDVESGAEYPYFDVLNVHDKRARRVRGHIEEGLALQVYFTIAPVHEVACILNLGVSVEPNLGRSEEHTSELQSRENLVC